MRHEKLSQKKFRFYRGLILNRLQKAGIDTFRIFSILDRIGKNDFLELMNASQYLGPPTEKEYAEFCETFDANEAARVCKCGLRKNPRDQVCWRCSAFQATKGTV